ncbi:MAG: hypothetical protein IT439_06165, partial [Phycisphaerales bacterium]|nr:hypothetical protein [Phycisphaerales bacterium]
GADSVSGTGTLTIRPADENTDLDVGNIAGAGGTPGAGLRFGLGDLGAIADGFASVEFGWETIGNYAMQIAGINNQTGNHLVFHSAAGGTITFLNHFFNDGFNLTVNGDATFGSDLEVRSGTGLQAWNGAIDLGAFNGTFSANLISFDGGADSVTGTGIINIRPADEFTDLDIGNVLAAGGVQGGGLRFGIGDLAALADGFSQVWFGYAILGQNTIQIGDVTGTSALNDATFFWASAGGSITVLRNLATDLDGSLHFISPTSAIVLDDGANITVGDGSLTFAGDVTVTGTASAVADGTVTFDGEVQGVAGGSAESLTVGSGMFDTTFQGLVAGAGGFADATGLTNLTFASGNNITFNDILSIGGLLSSTSRLTGLFTTGGNDIEVGGINLVGTDFAFDGITGFGDLAFDNDGTLAFNGDVTTLGSLNQVSGGGTGMVEAGGNLTSAGGDITFQSVVTLTAGPLEFSVISGVISFGDPFVASPDGMLDLAGFELTLTAQDVNFFGGPGSVKDTLGGGGLVLQPSDPSQAIDVGDVSVAQAGAFSVSNDDLAALSAVGDLTIGRSDGAHTNFVVEDATFLSNVTLRSPLGGVFELLGTISNSGFGIFVDGVDVQFAADIDTGGGAMSITGPVTLNADSSITTLGGNVDINDTVNGGFALAVSAFDGVNRGNVNFRGVIGGGSSLTGLDVEGWDVLLTGIGGGSAGVSGSVLVNAHDDVIFSGGTYNAFAQVYNAGDENRMNVVDTTFTSNGADITFGIAAGPVGNSDAFQGVFLLGRHALTVNTGGGNLFLDGGIDASFGGTGTPDVVFDAGGGAISVAGAIGAGNIIGSVDFTGSSISVNGVATNRFQLFAATTTFINGDHSTALAGSGPIEFTGDVVLAGDSSLTTAGDNILVAGRVDGPFVFIADAGASGDVTIGDAIGSSAALTGLSLTGSNIILNGIGTETDPGVTGATVVTAGDGLSLFDGVYNTDVATYAAGASGILLNADTLFACSDDDLTFVGAIHGFAGSEDLTINAGNGEVSLEEVGTQPDGTDPASTPTIGDIGITAGEVNLNGNVFGTNIVLQPGDAGAAIVIGGSDNGTAGDGIFTLTAAEIGFLAPVQPAIGFSTIRIGQLGGSHDVTVNAIEFFDPTTISANGAGGSINVVGDVTGSDDASLLFSGLTNLSADVTTAGNAATFTGGVNVLADSTVDTDGGDIQLTGALNGPAGLTLNGFGGMGSGNVTIDGIIGATTALANLTLDGFDNALFRVGTDLAQGVLGTLTLVAADDNIFNGVGYFAGSMIIAAGDENRVARDDTAFRTPGGDVSFNDGRLLLRSGNSASFDTAGGDLVFADGIQGDSAAPGAGDVLITTGAGSTTMLAGVGTVDKIATLDITSASISLLDVSTSGSQTYTGTTTLGGDLMSMTAGDITVNGDVTLEDDITVSTAGNAGDDIAFNGAIIGGAGDGLDADGAAVSFGGDVLLDGEDLVVTGDDITFGAFAYSAVGFDINGGTVTFEGGTLTSEASLIDISGTTIDFGAVLNANGGASVLFTNSGDLTFEPGARLNLTGDFVQLGAGTVFWNIASFTTFNDISVAALVTTGDVSFSGPVRLGTNMHVGGNNVAFLNTIDSADASERSFSVDAAGTVTLGDAIGGVFDLAQVFVQTDGAITVGDNVTTTSDQTYNGPLTVLGATEMTSGGRTTFSSNVTLDDDLTVRSFDTITFGADILGTDTPGDLTLEITQDIPVFLAETAEDQARAMPVIAIGGSMGTADDPLGEINLNVVEGTRVSDPDNLSAYPATATILIGVPGEPEGTPVSTIDVFADSFCVGFFEKVSFFGNLNMVLDPAGAAEGVLKIGDAVVMGTARIQADRIEFQRRPRANYLSAFITGEDTADFTYGLQDAGADFIVLGVNADMGFDDEPLTEDVLTVVGNVGDVVVETVDATIGDSEVAGNFFIGLPAGRSSVADASQDALLTVVITQPLEQYGRQEMFIEDLAVDIDGRGVAGNSAVARAGAIAAADDLAELPQDTSVGASAQEVLNQMGIQLIDVGPDALLDSLVGWALYNDLASSLGPDENKITRNRVDLTLVDRVISTYNRLFNVTGPDGTIVGSRQAEIKQGFTDAFIAWLTATNAEAFDAGAFDAWIRTSPPEAAQAANDLELLRELLNLIDLLGLSPREFSYARNTILSYIKPDDLSTEDFSALVEGAAAPAPAEAGQ